MLLCLSVVLLLLPCLSQHLLKRLFMNIITDLLMSVCSYVTVETAADECEPSEDS